MLLHLLFEQQPTLILDACSALDRRVLSLPRYNEYATEPMPPLSLFSEKPEQSQQQQRRRQFITVEHLWT